jgi:hypothetical protein
MLPRLFGGRWSPRVFVTLVLLSSVFGMLQNAPAITDPAGGTPRITCGALGGQSPNTLGGKRAGSSHGGCSSITTTDNATLASVTLGTSPAWRAGSSTPGTNPVSGAGGSQDSEEDW